MTEFVTMLAANTNHNGNIRGVVVKTSDLKAGSGANGDWTMKRFTLQDSTGEVEITCWNTDTGRFQEGQYYEVQNLTWKPRKDKPEIWQCGISKNTIITKLDNPPTQSTMELEPPKPSTTEHKTTIPALAPTTEATVGANTLLMVQIEHKVRDVLMDLLGKSPNDGQVGMYTRMNFYFLKGMDAKD